MCRCSSSSLDRSRRSRRSGRRSMRRHLRSRFVSYSAVARVETRPSGRRIYRSENRFAERGKMEVRITGQQGEGKSTLARDIYAAAKQRGLSVDVYTTNDGKTWVL